MSFFNTTRSLAFIAAAIIFAAYAGAEEKGDSKAAERYESPKAVFDAYREARAKRVWRKVFALLTPEVQNTEVFESFFMCMERQGGDSITGHRAEAKAIGALVDKYVDAKLGSDYEKDYKKKHGIDLAKFRAEHEHHKTPVEGPRQDEDLWRSAVAAHVKDKAGFYEAVVKYFHDRDVKRHEEAPFSPLGDLKELVVHGDTAEGRAKKTVFPNVAAGEGPLKPGEAPLRYDKPFKFRRVNGGWLIDSL